MKANLVVLDASALVELVLATATGKKLADRIASPAISVHVPHLADLEVLSVLRRELRDGHIDAGRANLARQHLRELDLRRHAHDALAERIWPLRDNLSAYDAAYVALAEGLDGVLLARDARLARAAGLRCRVELLAN